MEGRPDVTGHRPDVTRQMRDLLETMRRSWIKHEERGIVFTARRRPSPRTGIRTRPRQPDR